MADFVGGYKDKYELLLTGLMDTSLKASELRVLAAICDRYNHKNGACWPSIKSLAKDTRLSVRQVLRAVSYLEDAEYISTTKAHREVTEYVLNFDRIDAESHPSKAKY